MTTIAITGATGFLGSALGRALRADGVRVVSIGRAADSDVRWDPDREHIDVQRLPALDAVVHLAGENLAQRWTAGAKRRILDSRVKGTALLARTLAQLHSKPQVLVSASAVGIYGAHRGDEILTESSALGSDYLAEIGILWEASAKAARDAGIRVVHNRTGVVLHPESGMLQKLLPIFALGVGGKVGSGKQWLPWIARTDWVRAVRFLLETNVEGPFNVSAPNPVTNAEFTVALGRVLKRPTIVSVPAVAVKVAYGQMGEDTVLASQRMIPERLVAAGFRFEFPELDGALRHELRGR